MGTSAATPSMQQDQQSPSLNVTQSRQQPQISTSSSSSLQPQPQSPYPYTNQNPTFSSAQSQSGQNIQLRSMANAGISQTVNENTKVELDGLASHDPNGGTIIAYQWIQLPMGVHITLIGADTATPTFTAPVVPTDPVLGFSLSYGLSWGC